MQESFKRILTGTIIFVLTVAIAIIGYVLFGWTLFDTKIQGYSRQHRIL